MKKVIIFIVLLSTAVLSYLLLSNSNQDTASIKEKILEAPQLEEEELIFDDKELDNLDMLEEDIKALKMEKIKPLVRKQEELEKEVKDIIVEADIEEVKEHFPTKKGISPLIAIAMPKGVVSQLNIGDKISLPYMGSGEYEATITSKTTHKNGSVSITGNLDDLGNDYSIVLTEGKNMSFGTINTPDGTFEIESKNGEGYVYSTNSIDNKWIDYSKSDTLEPHPH
jgi:hypothetical protein